MVLGPRSEKELEDTFFSHLIGEMSVEEKKDFEMKEIASLRKRSVRNSNQKPDINQTDIKAHNVAKDCNIL